jgi:hypothetical protein
VTEDYKEFIQIKIASGLAQGITTIMILPKKVVPWNVRLTWIMWGFFTGIVKRQIEEGTEEAIRRISAAATA